MYHASLLSILCKVFFKLNINLLCSMHHSALDYEGLGFKSYISSRLLKYLSLTNISKFVYCGNDCMKKHIGIGFSANNASVVYNLLEKKYIFRQGIKQRDSRLSKRLNILFIGRWHNVKNINGLLFFLKLLSNNHTINVKLIGPKLDIYNQKLTKMIKELDLEENIELLGYKSELEIYFHTNDFLVISSHSESYPMVACEAILNDCPVISNNVGDISEIVGKSGIIIDFKDESKLIKLSTMNLKKISNRLKKDIFFQKEILVSKHKYENFHFDMIRNFENEI